MNLCFHSKKKKKVFQNSFLACHSEKFSLEISTENLKSTKSTGEVYAICSTTTFCSFTLFTIQANVYSKDLKVASLDPWVGPRESHFDAVLWLIHGCLLLHTPKGAD